MNNKVNRALVAKKSSFKTTTLIAAIGMIVYTIYVLTRYVLNEYLDIHYVFDLATEIRIRLIYDILPISFIIACVGLWKQRPSKAVSKSFQVFSICILITLVGTLLFSPLYTIQIAGIAYLLPSIYWRAIMLISGIVWLFMLMRQPLEEASPRSYRVTLILAILLLAFPVMLEIASGISVLCSGYVLSFASSSIKSWIRWIAPILPLAHFVFPQIKDINTTRNSYCTPVSDAERTFNRNRKITLIAVGITITTLCLGFIGFFIGERLYYRQMFLHTLGEIAFVCFCIALIALIVSWIMLSIMAFRQLPNPQGYKIYNITCQVLTWGSLLASFFVPVGMDEAFGAIFLISFFAFFVTTTIRVISYSLPKPLEQSLHKRTRCGINPA